MSKVETLSTRLQESEKVIHNGTMNGILKLVFLIIIITSHIGAVNAISGIATADPIVWERTRHTIAEDLINTYDVIKLISPCSILKQNNTKLDCESRYEELVLNPIFGNCPKTNESIKDIFVPPKNRIEKRSVGIILQGAKFLFDNYDKIVHVGQSVIGFIAQWIQHFRINKLQTNQVKQSEQMNALLRNQRVMLEKFTVILNNLTESQQKNNKLIENIMQDLVMSTVLNPKLLIINQNLRKFFSSAKKSHVPFELTLLFPNLFHSDENYEQWDFIGCMVYSQSYLVLEFVVPRIYRDLVIYESHPFSLYQNHGNELCKYEYVGPRFMLYNEQKDCVRKLRIHPNHGRPSQSFLINKPNDCDASDPSESLWAKKDCDKDENLAREDLQFHFNDRSVFFYCYNQNITIDNRTSTCENKIYKLPIKKEFKVGDYHHKAEYHRRFGNHQLDLYENMHISQNLFGGLENYFSSGKSLEILLQDIEQIQGNQKKNEKLFWWFFIPITSLIVMVLFCVLSLYSSTRKKLTTLKNSLKNGKISDPT